MIKPLLLLVDLCNMIPTVKATELYHSSHLRSHGVALCVNLQSCSERKKVSLWHSFWAESRSIPSIVRFCDKGCLSWGQNEDLFLTCCLFLALTWLSHSESVCHPILLLILPVHYQKQSLYTYFCTAYSMVKPRFCLLWRLHWQCGVGSYNIKFPTYCSCHLEIKQMGRPE